MLQISFMTTVYLKSLSKFLENCVCHLQHSLILQIIFCEQFFYLIFLLFSLSLGNEMFTFTIWPSLNLVGYCSCVGPQHLLQALCRYLKSHIQFRFVVMNQDVRYKGLPATTKDQHRHQQHHHIRGYLELQVVLVQIL